MINLDYLDPVQLTGFVRELPGPATYVLNRFLPDRNIQDIEAAWDLVNRTNRAAMFRAWDSETPIGRRDVFERRRIALPPIGQKTVVGEFERLQLERVRSGGDNRNRIVEAIYDDAEINTRAVFARMELARGDVLTDGKFTLTGENGLTIEADYGVDPTHIVNASVVWSDYDDSDPVQELRAWADTYADDAGEPPAYALTSRTVVAHLMRNDAIRAYAATLGGTPAVVTRSQLDTVFAAWDLPQLVVYDTRIDVNGSTTRPIPTDKVVLLPQDPSSLGFTAWGVTAESLELASGQNPSLEFTEAPGLVGVVMKEGDPLRIWTKVGAVGMPIITDPRRLMVADVLT
jgi:hypothetical protein